MWRSLTACVWAGLLAAIGCAPTITCEQTGCPYGQQCSASSGLCERPETDCRKAPQLCSADQRCDERSGACRSLQVSCVGDTLLCPAGQECNTSRGVCQPVTDCASDRDCTGRDICDTQTRRCAPPPCVEAADCAAGTVCEEGACVAGCLPPDSLCPSGQYCRISEGATRGQCLSECGQDTDCPYGRFCDFVRRPPICELEPACVADEDCRADEVCDAGQCDRAPCAGDQDCAAGQRCDQLTGVCGSCADDALAPNQDAASAITLEAGRFVDLRVCPGQADWFKLNLRAGEQVVVRASAPDGAPVSVALLDAELGELIADNQPGGDVSLSYRVPQAMTTFVRVRGDASYQLEIERLQLNTCREDRFEENDHAAQASSLRLNPGESIQLDLQLCGVDEDWFALRSVEQSAGLGVRLVQSAQASPLIELWTPDGARIDVPAQGERVLRRVGVAGDYLVRVRSPRQTDTSYTLGVNVRAPYNCPSSGQDDTPESALSLEPSTPLIQELCPNATDWETDWIALKAPAAPTLLTVKLVPSASAPTMQLALMERVVNAQPALVRIGQPDAGRAQRLAAQVRPDQELLLRLTASGAPGRLLDAPTYQLIYELSQQD